MNLLNGLGGSAGFGENYIARNDDGYAANIDIRPVFGSAGLNFFGTSYTHISINNNGNVTFGGTGLSSYTPWGMQQATGQPMIAAYFADVDTRGYTTAVDGPNAVTPTAGGTSRGSNLVWYDMDASQQRLTITWDDVGYFSNRTDKLNAFQMVLTGTGGGRFRIEFRYEAMNWTTGSYSGGVDGLGGTVARAGFTAGDGANYYELAQSGIQSQMLDLDTTPGNTGVSGYYLFSHNGGSDGNETIVGDAGNNVLFGGGGNDVIYGRAGDDQLDGGTGTNKLYGETGDDIYIVRSTYDTVYELVNAGIDTVQTGITYRLTANVENLILTGSANINGTGNGLNNRIVSNRGNNVISGGTGIDTASYELAAAAVSVSLAVTVAQNTGDGLDKLVSIENLTGSVFNDILTGNGGANVLNGLNGADRMVGGLGNDTYVVDNVSDVVVEAANGGSDTVQTVLSYVLRANVENLVLTGGDAVNGFGNDLDNILVGNGAANRLSGGRGNDALVGGGGQDLLTGGAGTDIFMFQSLGDREDIVTDFTVGDDRLWFDRSAFGGLPTGQLASTRFESRADSGAATRTGTRFVFNQADSALYYDRDGLGGAAAVRIATLDAVPTLAASSILIG